MFSLVRLVFFSAFDIVTRACIIVVRLLRTLHVPCPSPAARGATHCRHCLACWYISALWRWQLVVAAGGGSGGWLSWSWSSWCVAASWRYSVSSYEPPFSLDYSSFLFLPTDTYLQASFFLIIMLLILAFVYGLITASVPSTFWQLHNMQLAFSTTKIYHKKKRDSVNNWVNFLLSNEYKKHTAVNYREAQSKIRWTHFWCNVEFPPTTLSNFF